jgi:hypothetical protein
MECWAAHPLKNDPSDKYPGKKDTILPNNANVDVFFLHPTTFTKQKNLYSCNGDVFDTKLNQKTDNSAILFQASAFNNHTRVFAPRYRQAHFNAYFTKDKETAQKAFDLAYQDVLLAFETYLKNHPMPGEDVEEELMGEDNAAKERYEKEMKEENKEISTALTTSSCPTITLAISLRRT